MACSCARRGGRAESSERKEGFGHRLGTARRMTVERSDWTDNFRAWIALLPPVDLADILDVLVLELERRDLGDQDVLRKAAETVRGHRAVRLRRLVDSFVSTEPRSHEGQTPTDTVPGVRPTR